MSLPFDPHANIQSIKVWVSPQNRSVAMETETLVRMSGAEILASRPQRITRLTITCILHPVYVKYKHISTLNED